MAEESKERVLVHNGETWLYCGPREDHAYMGDLLDIVELLVLESMCCDETEVVVKMRTRMMTDSEVESLPRYE